MKYLRASEEHTKSYSFSGSMHHLNTYGSFVVCHLDLTRVRKFDHGSDGHLKLPPGLQIQPHIVPLEEEQSSKQIIEYNTIPGMQFTVTSGPVGFTAGATRGYYPKILILRSLSGGCWYFSGEFS